MNSTANLPRKRVVFAEGLEPRIIRAAAQLRDQDDVECILVGTPTEIEQAAALLGISLSGLHVVDPLSANQTTTCAQHVQDLRQFKSIAMAERLVKKPLPFAAALVAIGEADLMVGGATCATKKVIEAAAMCIGFANDAGLASSFFLMQIPNRSEPILFADCAVNIDPDAEALANIAISTARSAQALIGSEARVAMLSFSTQGSASHAAVDKVRSALEIAKALAPELKLDGEMQVDTALSARVAATKWQGSSEVAGQANVLIFPNLEAGNIGYKLVQQFTGARAIGPILQGFKRPVADLSRGASVDEIVEVTRLSLL
jgi:phosphate acetyltransferase